MNKAHVQKNVIPAIAAIYLLLYIGRIFIMLIPMPSNMMISVQTSMFETGYGELIYIFDGLNGITCYDGSYYVPYNKDRNIYYILPEGDEVPESMRYKIARKAKTNVFQKLLILKAAYSISLGDLGSANTGAYRRYRTADTPTTYGNTFSVCMDGHGTTTDIMIQGSWSNKYYAFCNKSLVDFYAATLLACPAPKKERSFLEDWVRRHWWHMKRAH